MHFLLAKHTLARVVEVIPARPVQRGPTETAKLRVCAYCRVSTDTEEQLNSFDAQVSHYTHSISQASRQGIVYRFREGKVRVNHSKFLGYTKNDEGGLVIDPEQAEIVKRVFTEYLEGASCRKIAEGLEEDGVLTGSGGAKWYESSGRRILRNEKYMGDALLQKTYTVDFLSKKRVVNEGHVPQYYVEDSHPAIIPKEVFEAAQAEMARRSGLRGYSKTGKSCYAAKYPFSGRLVCGHCGAKFTRKQWGKDKFVWMCINRMKNGVKACPQKAVKEPLVERVVVKGRQVMFQMKTGGGNSR